MDPLRVLLVSSEVAPLAKTGGLADVVAALGTRLHRRGHDVRIVMPLYRRLREQDRPLEDVEGLAALPVRLGPVTLDVAIRRTRLPGGDVPVLCVDAPALYDRPGIYTSDPDEHLRFGLLARAALSLCQATAWAPDVVHANDWHVALLPLYVRLLSSWERLLADTRTVLTIHNIGFQGIVGRDAVADLGLDDAEHLLPEDDLAAGRLNLLKTGILFADVVTTVSRTYAREIQTEELGMGLAPVLRARADRLVGIVNGIDEDEWDPATDPLVPQHYGPDTVADKAIDKVALLATMGLPPGAAVPVFGIVSRLTAQKGFELLFESLPELLGHHDCRLVVLGSGEPRYEKFFSGLARRFPHRCAFHAGYSNELAHLIEAGADAFLMPSRYEPCGLNQMYSQRYGTVPIVRRTGGLADTVVPFDAETGEGTGIVFEHFDARGMRWALLRALELYHRPEAWPRLVANGMAQDFGWDRRVGEYEQLYRTLLAEPARPW